MKNTAAQAKEVLLYADSEGDADMLYFGGVFVPDAFIAFSDGVDRVAVVSQLEFARVRREGSFTEVLPLEELLRPAQAAFPQARYPATVIALLARQRGIKTFRVADTFPFAVAQQLLELKVGLQPAGPGGLFSEREFKTDDEAAAIRAGNAAASAGFRAAERLLKAAEVRGGKLFEGGKVLTSERVQEAIAIACLSKGAVAANTIVAGGDQACDPHCRGSGPLRAGEFIIIDIFPRVSKTGYHGDMTRTYLKGRASDAQKHLYQTVFEAQQKAVAAHQSRKSARRIYQDVCEHFKAAGYTTRKEDGVAVGFIHGLGHGLGLEVHEPPRVNAHGGVLRKGQVITVEPGLYYPGLGGVRVEDVVRVAAGEPEWLSKHPYRWNIR
jgi:Xaa-Pro aminopeptidase